MADENDTWLPSTVVGWWTALTGWWGDISEWLDTFFSDLTNIFDSWGIAEWVSDFVLSWGDWIVGWAKAIAIGAISYLAGAFFWRAITFFLGAAVVSQALFILKTGFATYLIVWFMRVVMRSLGIGFVAFTAWQTNLIPKIEKAMDTVLHAVPKEFMPMMEYFSVFDALHFLFAVFVVIATLKVSMWVFKPPLDLP